MNKYKVVEEVLLKVADAITTTRIGLSDGRIMLGDSVKSLDSASEALAQALRLAQDEGDEDAEVALREMIRLKQIING